MAYFARVPRELMWARQLEALYAVQQSPPPTPQSKSEAIDGPSPNASKRQNKNRKWQKLDLNNDTIAGNTRPGAIDPFHSPAHPAPSSLHQPTPDTPTPPGSEFNQHNQSSTPATQGSSTMTRPNGNQAGRRNYVPPHLRGRKFNASSPANTKDKSEALKPVGNKPEGALQSSQTAANSRPEAPLSPPSSPPGHVAETQMAAQLGQMQLAGEETAQAEAVWDYDEPKPEPPQKPKRRHRNFGSPPRRPKHVWPKNRDMKPRSDDEDEWGGVGFKSDSNGDPDYDIKKLVDWDGNWNPPPETWSDRHQFIDRHFGASIEKWINGHDASCTVNLTDMLESPDYVGIKVEGEVVLIDGHVVADRTINKEIAPRSWIHTKIEGDAPQSFWRTLPGRAPSPLSDIDLAESHPYWEEYSDDRESPFLNPYQHPVSTLDPNDEENGLPGATMTATEFVKARAEDKAKRQKRREAKRNRPFTVPDLPPPAPGYRPTSNVYFRPVLPADAKGIQELYNHYVENTISTPEFAPRTTPAIVERIRTITDAGLPYLVAVAKGLRPRGPQAYISERIVGIAYIDDYCDKGSTYRYTFELEMYVHPDYVRQNIAKCLLDRLLEMVSPSYPARGGYDWVNRGEYLKHGALRVVKVVNINFPHAQGDDIEWFTNFMRTFRFRKAGHWLTMGHKFGKVIDVTTYQHETSEMIDAGGRPPIPL